MIKYLFALLILFSLAHFTAAQETPQCYCYPVYARCVGVNAIECGFLVKGMCFTSEIGSSDVNDNGVPDDVDKWTDQFKDRNPKCADCDYGVSDYNNPVKRDCSYDPNYLDNSPKTLTCGFYTLDNGETVCTGACPVNVQTGEDGSTTYRIGSCEHTPGEISTCGCVYDEYKTIIDSGGITKSTVPLRPAPVQGTDSTVLLVAGSAIGLIALLYFVKKQ
ncbi:hypothetical protein HUU53_02830 [Candidatus Micrarchaeota archaeon]|nr:hypothetical protein [Candidatus Micrarchaeota archaeon]